MQSTVALARMVANVFNPIGASNTSNKPLTSQLLKTANSPLGTISMFFGVVELGLAYSSGVTDGWVQIAVLSFMGLFVVAIAATFFVFLWYRPWVFYPPSEFAGASVQAYVNAMRGDGPSITQITVDSLSRAFSDDSLLENLHLGRVPDEERQAFVNGLFQEVRARVIANVGASVILVDPRPIKGKHASQWEEPYDPQMPVERLLDRIWLRLQPFAPYPYGTSWILRDAATGKIFDNIGSSNPTGHRQDGTKNDRTAEEVGFKGGMTLEVVNHPT